MKHFLLITIATVLLVGCGKSAPDISFHEAAALGNIKTIKKYLDADTDVNAKSKGLFDWSALHYATGSGHYESVQLLIKKGANVNISGPSGTPLHHVLLYGQKKQITIAKLLISNGADVNAKNKTGEKPLHHAAAKGFKETAELLIAKGADVNAKNNFDRTPLHWAAQHGRKALVMLLINEGADVNSKTQEGLSPLHRSSSFEHVEVSKLLISKGADVNSYCAGRTTPLHHASYRQNKEAIELLIAKGAKVNFIDARGKTPLDANPKRKQKKEITDLLRKHGGKTGDELIAEIPKPEIVLKREKVKSVLSFFIGEQFGISNQGNVRTYSNLFWEEKGESMTGSLTTYTQNIKSEYTMRISYDYMRRLFVQQMLFENNQNIASYSYGIWNEKTQTMTWNSSNLGRMKSESVQSFNSPNESTIKTKTWNKAGRHGVWKLTEMPVIRTSSKPFEKELEAEGK